MKQAKNRIYAVCAVVIFIAACAGCFFLGKKYEQDRIREEQDLNILLNRSELEGLGAIEGPIYVTGHKSPDTDTVGSAIAYAALLHELGYDAKPVILGIINNETRFILEQAGLKTPEFLTDASGLNMVLVDHSEYSQSADGLEDATVISIIDHHSDGSVTTGNQLIYDARPLGSTSTIIWLRYKNYGLVPDKQTAYVMAGAILSDTLNLQSKNTTFADREALKELSGIAGLKDTDALYQEMYKASVSYEGMTDEEIFFSDYKEYESGGFRYSIGCINALDEDAAKDLAERMRKTMPGTLSSTGMDMSFAMISVFHDDISVIYLVPSDDAAKEVLEAALGDKITFDGSSFRAGKNMSRKKDVVPAITDVLESHPKE